MQLEFPGKRDGDDEGGDEIRVVADCYMNRAGENRRAILLSGRGRGLIKQQIGDGHTIGLGFNLSAQHGGELAGKFRVAAGVTKCRGTDNRRALFFRSFQRRLCLSKLLPYPLDFLLLAFGVALPWSSARIFAAGQGRGRGKFFIRVHDRKIPFLSVAARR